MKVLLSAVACNPYFHSESYVGWNAVKALAHDHDLWVLTSRRNEPDLQRAADEGLVPENVHFVYAGEFASWHPSRLRARLQSWREYINFSKAILPVARQLHATEKFDIAHHVTCVTWRVASPLGLLGIPFVFGPVGGYEQFPLRLLPILSLTAAGFELARVTSNIVSRFSPDVRRCIRQAAHVFVANPETKWLVRTLRGSTTGVTELSAAFYSDAQIKDFSRFVSGKTIGGPLRLFAGGNLEGRKGLALALPAVAIARENGVKFQFRIGGGGSELSHLRQIAGRLGLGSEVSFADLRGEAYQQELGSSHIFLLPSLRESAGLTMMEAMLAGSVPVVVDAGGPGSIVTEECGYKIPATNRPRMIHKLAEAVILIDRNRQLILDKGRAASLRIATHFSEVNYRDAVNAVYESLTSSVAAFNRC
jgi:glycosyltransferase involved in cell wall biosynthesis